MPHATEARTYRVGILGATGNVGQRFISLLADHPWFRITRLGASKKWEEASYAEADCWRLPGRVPACVRDLPLVSCDVSNFVEHCDLVFSALDAHVAKDIERAFALAGLPVFSNAKSHRYDPTVPILIPYVNPEHLDIVKEQPAFEKSGGFIVTNANCSTTGLCVALAPLRSVFSDLQTVVVTTLQAISGAGYPGASAMDIMGNVIPHIDGEEEKLAVETQKILGALTEDRDGNRTLEPAALLLSASCNRVPVLDGHTLTVSFKAAPPASGSAVQLVENAFDAFQPPPAVRGLPSCPPHPIHHHRAQDRPQPREDCMEGGGMTVVVGRVRPCRVNTVKFTAVVHNTVLGAAGGSILNAELAASRGLLRRNT